MFVAHNIFMESNTPRKKQLNPVVEIYRGIEIVKYTTVKFRVNVSVMKEIIDARLDTEMSDRQILGYSSCPCEHCKGSVVAVTTKSKKQVEVKRGILSKFIPKK